MLSVGTLAERGIAECRPSDDSTLLLLQLACWWHFWWHPHCWWHPIKIWSYAVKHAFALSRYQSSISFQQRRVVMRLWQIWCTFCMLS